MTCDCWQSNATESFLGMTSHYINSDFELKNKVLCLRYLEDPKTSIYLKQKIEAILNEWNVLNKVIFRFNKTPNKDVTILCEFNEKLFQGRL